MIKQCFSIRGPTNRAYEADVRPRTAVLATTVTSSPEGAGKGEAGDCASSDRGARRSQLRPAFCCENGSDGNERSSISGGAGGGAGAARMAAVLLSSEEKAKAS